VQPEGKSDRGAEEKTKEREFKIRKEGQNGWTEEKWTHTQTKLCSTEDLELHAGLKRNTEKENHTSEYKLKQFLSLSNTAHF
jgi:hypothetical protein